MQKKLIALAVAGALAAPLAAQAETTIYGKAHVSIDYINNDNSTAPNDTSLGVSSNSSRIGFKGSEDLGGGLKAVWQAEGTVDLAGTDSNMFNRNSFLGLAGGFGTFIAGRHDTPYKTVGRKVDLFGDTVGDYRSLSNNSGQTIAGTKTPGFESGQDARTNNTIAYITPDFGGLTAALAYVTDASPNDKTKNDNTDKSAYSASLNYANGPLYAGVAYQSIKGDAFSAGSDDSKAARVAASYKVAGFKINAMWQKDTAMGGESSADRDSWLLGAAYGFGNNTVKVQYFSAGKINDASNTDASKAAIGIDHAFSKQTSVYLAYAVVNNGDSVNYNITGSGHGDTGPAGGTDLGGSPSALSLGMTHKF